MDAELGDVGTVLKLDANRCGAEGLIENPDMSSHELALGEEGVVKYEVGELGKLIGADEDGGGGGVSCWNDPFTIGDVGGD